MHVIEKTNLPHWDNPKDDGRVLFWANSSSSHNSFGLVRCQRLGLLKQQNLI